MNYRTMLDKMLWDDENIKGVVDKLDRILSALRAYLADSGTEDRGNSTYQDFWKCVFERNIYIGVLLLKRQEKKYGTQDLCTYIGFETVNPRIRIIHTEGDDVAVWRMLTEAELNRNYHIVEYARLLRQRGKLKEAMKCFHNSDDFVNTVIFFLNTCCVLDAEFRREVFRRVAHLKWIIEVSELDNKELLREIVGRLVQWNDIVSLVRVIDSCEGDRVTGYSDKTVTEWKDYLVGNLQPLSMITYRKILEKEGLGQKEILEQLYDFTFWATQKSAHIINNYVFFAYAVSDMPQQYDTYAAYFDNDSSTQAEAEISLGAVEAGAEEGDAAGNVLSEVLSRGLTFQLVDEPFIALIRRNPAKVPDYLERIGSLSLYHDSRSLEYRKSKTWVDKNYLQDYMNYLSSIMKSFPPEKVLDIYMNSPMKSQVDFSYVVRHLYQPKENYVDLTKVFDKYVLRGKLVKIDDRESSVAYRVTLSNASSSYLLPIHHSWVKLHEDEFETKLIVGSPVYYKIMSVNSRGMVFAYDLTPRPKNIAEKQNETVQSFAFYEIERFKEGLLPLQADNLPEKVQMFVMAMIHDESDRIMVKKYKNGEKTTESLPVLPLANGETSYNALKRLLKYFIGFRGEMKHGPCGIRHICVGKQQRSIFFIYKIDLSECKKRYKELVYKKSCSWRNIEEYKNNACDRVTESFLTAYHLSWSEAVHNLDSIDVGQGECGEGNGEQ